VGGIVGVVGEGRKTNGKTEKMAETVDTQGFAFSVLFSVSVSVFRSVLPFKGEPVGGLWEAGRLSCVCMCGYGFPHTLPLSQLFCWVEQQTEKRKEVVEIFGTQRFNAFRFFFPFPFPFSVPFYPSRGSLRACVWACFPFSLPYPFLLPYPVVCLTLQDGL
jgi:hypothetical protein